MKKRTNLKSIKYSLSLSKYDFAIMIILGIVNCLVGIVSVYSCSKFVGIIENNMDALEINYQIYMYLSLYILSLFIIFLYNNYYNRYIIQFKTVTRFERKIRGEIHKKSSRISNESFEKPEIYKTVTQTLNSAVNLFRLTQVIISIIIAIVTIICTTFYTSSFSWWYLLFIVFAILPSLIEIKYKEYDIKKNYKELNHISKVQYEYFDSFLEIDALKDAQMLNMSSIITRKHDELIDNRKKLVSNKNKKVLILGISLSLLKLIGSSAGLILSSILLFNGNINASGFTAGVSTYALLLSNFKNLFDLMAYQKSFETMNKPFFDFIELDERNGKSLMKFNDKITFDHVSFSYQNNEVIKDVSFEIKKGEKVAIVGINGSGKTTLVNLLLGNYLPTKGKVLYDGISTQDSNENILHQNQSYVQQNVMRYNLSLQDNLSFGNYSSELDKRISNLDLNLPKTTLLGLDFGGVDLSGGQWQRISIERSFYKNADIYVLDEPTSAIDPLKETKLYEEFDAETKDKTSIIITHRLGAIRLANKIIVMESGKIVEQGTHNELLKNNKLYAKMWNSQVDFFKV